MELYIGGYAQGKLRYVMQIHKGEILTVIEGADGVRQDTKTEGRIVVNHFHLWVKKLLQENKDAYKLTMQFLEQHTDCIVICDEIGNGLVPVAQEERDYRDLVGRLQIELAAKAEKVERVICGLGQKLKEAQKWN